MPGRGGSIGRTRLAVLRGRCAVGPRSRGPVGTGADRLTLFVFEEKTVGAPHTHLRLGFRAQRSLGPHPVIAGALPFHAERALRPRRWQRLRDA